MYYFYVVGIDHQTQLEEKEPSDYYLFAILLFGLDFVV